MNSLWLTVFLSRWMKFYQWFRVNEIHTCSQLPWPKRFYLHCLSNIYLYFSSFYIIIVEYFVTENWLLIYGPHENPLIVQFLWSLTNCVKRVPLLCPDVSERPPFQKNLISYINGTASVVCDLPVNYHQWPQINVHIQVSRFEVERVDAL